MPPKTLYIVDGNNHIYRAYHSLRSFATSAGESTGAVYGFTSMLRKLVREEKPDYLAVVFDKTEPSFRNDIYPEYKAHRPPPPEDLLPQLPIIREVCDGFGVTTLEMTGYEADDIIGTLAVQARARDEPIEVVIVSTDKDLMQLVGEGTVLYDTMKDIRYGDDEVETKTGVRPEQMVDYLALTGDSSDNIPGVPGIGPKTAAKLLGKYDTLDGLYAAIDAKDKSIKGKRLENLVGHKDDAYLSQTLATLKLDVPIDTAIEDLTIDETRRGALGKLFERLEFVNLTREFAAEELAASVPAPPEAEVDVDALKRDYSVVTELDALKDLTGTLRDAGRFAVSAVVTDEHPIGGRLVGLAFATDTRRAWYVPVGHQTLEAAAAQLSPGAAFEILGPLFEDAEIGKSAENVKRLEEILIRRGVALRGVRFDPMLASYLVDPDRYREHTLEAIAADRAGHEPLTEKKLLGTGKKKLTFDQIVIDSGRDFACERAQLTVALEPALAELMDEAGTRDLLDDLELPLSRVLAKMEVTGVRVDIPRLHQLGKDFGERARELEAECHALAGEEFNVGSPKQLGEILFKKLGLPQKKRTRTGYSTDNSVLEELSELHELPDKVIAWRSVSKLKSTYADALPQLVHPETGRIHTRFNQAVASTGRLSSAEPNLQNIPVRTEEGRRIREAFVAADGMRLVSADYSQIELRILAHLCGSDKMMQAFRDGVDIHLRTAAEMFEIADSGVTRKQRAMAKTINFGVLYGMGVMRLAREQGISRSEAKDFIERYFARYPSIGEWKEETLRGAREQGYVTTLMGRVRRVPDILARNRGRRAFSERVAINTPVQGSAADIIKKAMIVLDAELAEAFPETRMLLQVHDELVFEVPQAQVDAALPVIREAMERVVTLNVPLAVNASVGHNWLEAH